MGGEEGVRVEHHLRVTDRAWGFYFAKHTHILSGRGGDAGIPLPMGPAKRPFQHPGRVSGTDEFGKNLECVPPPQVR